LDDSGHLSRRAAGVAAGVAERALLQGEGYSAGVFGAGIVSVSVLAAGLTSVETVSVGVTFSSSSMMFAVN